MLGSRETLRRLHDAARPAPPDRRRPLRADARERRSAPRRLVGHLLSPGRRDGHRLRSHDARQQRRRPVPIAAARAVERPGHLPRDAAALVPPPAVGPPAGLGQARSGTASVRHYRRGAEGAAGDGHGVGDRCAARSTTSATWPCWRNCAGRPPTPRRGATRTCSYFQQFSGRTAGDATRDRGQTWRARLSGSPARERVGYAMGDVATNFFFQSMILYQTRFYTDTVGLSAVAVGTMFLVLRLADAVFDPAIGALADRTRTRWGSFRPWMLWTAVPVRRDLLAGVRDAGCRPDRQADLRLPDVHAADDALLRQQHAVLGADGRHDGRRQRTEQPGQLPVRGRAGRPVHHPGAAAAARRQARRRRTPRGAGR